ncbi:hypothetical protein [Deinococcus aquiradiocola]|uniref:hypothetical protein n=1 Tax=Deinococcus aquiradiocola TaxID=393059 RepID=UPI00166EB171|nr:hypothetical protein [Deinococcus aquiradiocola]
MTRPTVPAALAFGLVSLAFTALGTPGPFSWPLAVTCGMGAGVAALHTAFLAGRQAVAGRASRPAQHTPPPAGAAPAASRPADPPVNPVPVPSPTPRPPEASMPASPWPTLALPHGWTTEPRGPALHVTRDDRRRFVIATHPAALTGLQAGTTPVLWTPGPPAPPTRQGQAWQVSGPPDTLTALLEVL